MNTTHDPKTPIFGELNKELGELPEIDVHDFDMHAFDFIREAEAESAKRHEQAQVADSESATASATAGKKGGRRRKQD
ncbi:hypothetical protein HUO13_36750 [Saccharopolyspora erythraea]|uniref:hypothetical protein n=1 Tax=Saccharopolyspora erythraea TaxID=1836 RepID=UPI001BAA914C|nr:hypothetical protein [Saccharopolyspora erythraea]QUH05590.1 hypothetical protein HUO13_36750 [Saccharopolyspora erythraea]